MTVLLKKRISTLESDPSGEYPFGNSYRLLEVPQPDYSKIELNPHIESPPQVQNEAIEAIVKVSEKDYLPPGIKVRARISSYIFTAELLVSDIEQLEKDAGVVSISVSRGLRSLTSKRPHSSGPRGQRPL